MSQDAAALARLSFEASGLRMAMESVLAGATPDHGKWGAAKSFAGAYNAIAERYASLTGDQISIFDQSKMTGPMSSTWIVLKSNFDTVYIYVSILTSKLSGQVASEASSSSTIQDLLAANLRKVIYAAPTREVDVQNAVETLLVGRGYQKGLNYDRESGKIEFSGKEFIPDFVFRDIGMALEVKLVRQRADISKCIEEMSSDATAYAHAYSKILFLVYDLGEIRDVHEIQSGFEKLPGVRVCIVKH